MSKSLILNAGWLAVAAGAFIAGKSMNSGDTGVTVQPKGAAEVAGHSAKLDAPAAKATKQVEEKAGGSDAETWLKHFRSADGTISASRMAEAVDEAIREGDLVKSSLYFATLLKDLTPENADAAMKTVREKSTGFDTMRFLPLLAYAWGQKDGKSALAAFDAMGGREAGFGKSSVMAGWAASDPDAAIAYHDAAKAKRLAEAAASGDSEAGNNNNRGRGRGPGGPGEDWGIDRGIVSGLARRSVDEAMAYVGKMDEKARPEFVRVVADQKLKEGTASAAAWAQGLSDVTSKTRALEQVGQQWARQDLTGAAGWAATVSNDPQAKEAVGQIAEQYADKNVSDAYKWAQGLNGDGQKAAVSEVFNRWAREDAPAASEELAKLEAGNMKDEAIQSFSRSLARSEPQDAMTWATSISDAAAREEAQIEVARRWMGSDQQAAQNWIASNLSVEAQQKAAAPQDRGNWGGGGGRGFGGFGRGGN